MYLKIGKNEVSFKLADHQPQGIDGSVHCQIIDGSKQQITWLAKSVVVNRIYSYCRSTFISEGAKQKLALMR